MSLLNNQHFIRHCSQGSLSRPSYYGSILRFSSPYLSYINITPSSPLSNLLGRNLSSPMLTYPKIQDAVIQTEKNSRDVSTQTPSQTPTHTSAHTSAQTLAHTSTQTLAQKHCINCHGSVSANYNNNVAVPEQDILIESQNQRQNQNNNQPISQHFDIKSLESNDQLVENLDVIVGDENNIIREISSKESIPILSCQVGNKSIDAFKTNPKCKPDRQMNRNYREQKETKGRFIDEQSHVEQKLVKRNLGRMLSSPRGDEMENLLSRNENHYSKVEKAKDAIKLSKKSTNDQGILKRLLCCCFCCCFK